jgi:hypothetical protein
MKAIVPRHNMLVMTLKIHAHTAAVVVIVVTFLQLTTS